MQLPSVDILHVHDFEYCQSPTYIAKTTLPAVLKIVQSGKARWIGFTGYPIEQFRKVLELTPVKVNAVLSYCRNTLIDMSLQVPFIIFCDFVFGEIKGFIEELNLQFYRGVKFADCKQAYGLY